MIITNIFNNICINIIIYKKEGGKVKRKEGRKEEMKEGRKEEKDTSAENGFLMVMVVGTYEGRKEGKKEGRKEARKMKERMNMKEDEGR
jgi:hypothetical protein